MPHPPQSPFYGFEPEDALESSAAVRRQSPKRLAFEMEGEDQFGGSGGDDLVDGSVLMAHSDRQVLPESPSDDHHPSTFDDAAPPPAVASTVNTTAAKPLEMELEDCFGFEETEEPEEGPRIKSTPLKSPGIGGSAVPAFVSPILSNRQAKKKPPPAPSVGEMNRPARLDVGDVRNLIRMGPPAQQKKKEKQSTLTEFVKRPPVASNEDEEKRRDTATGGPPPTPPSAFAHPRRSYSKRELEATKKKLTMFHDDDDAGEHDEDDSLNKTDSRDTPECEPSEPKKKKKTKKTTTRKRNASGHNRKKDAETEEDELVKVICVFYPWVFISY